jgi:adenine deaminase
MAFLKAAFIKMVIDLFQASDQQIIDVARGDTPATLVIANGNVVNVYSGEILRQNIGIYRDRIAYVGPEIKATDNQTQIIDASDLFVAPGFIEPHAHPFMLYDPNTLFASVLPLGITTMALDNLIFYEHLEVNDLLKLIQELHNRPPRQLWLARLLAQAEYKSMRSHYAPANIKKLLSTPYFIGVAETTDWMRLYQGDHRLLDVIHWALNHGKVVDGHTAGASFDKLNAVAASGVQACHEAITPEEVLDRLRLGFWTALRHSSLRPDLPELLKVITTSKIDTSRLMLTTDGTSPSDLYNKGFIDYLLKIAVENGVNPITAIQMATINPAKFLRIDHIVGGISPGKKADLVLLVSLKDFRPRSVIFDGKLVANDNKLITQFDPIDWTRWQSKRKISVDTIRVKQYFEQQIRTHRPQLAIEFVSNVITKLRTQNTQSHSSSDSDEKATSYIDAYLLTRDGKSIAHAKVVALMQVPALATTITTTNDILLLGTDHSAIVLALERLLEINGGIVIASEGRILYELALPLMSIGIMSNLDLPTLAKQQDLLFELLNTRFGFKYHDPTMSLFFLTCNFLPDARLNPLGLYSVRQRKVLIPAVTL